MRPISFYCSCNMVDSHCTNLSELPIHVLLWCQLYTILNFILPGKSYHKQHNGLQTMLQEFDPLHFFCILFLLQISVSIYHPTHSHLDFYNIYWIWVITDSSQCKLSICPQICVTPVSSRKHFHSSKEHRILTRHSLILKSQQYLSYMGRRGKLL